MGRKKIELVLEDRTKELKKHVAIIHSQNKLTLLQRKIANALLYNAYPELLTKDEHVIHIGTLCKIIGYDSNDHKSIKKSLVNLLSTVLEWNLVDGNKLDSDGAIWNASSIIADASIDGSYCTYSYSNKMKRLLYKPEIYGRLDMHTQSKFKSTYGLALYENCIRFQDIGQTPWIELSKFRKLMGVEDSKYKIFRDFKSRVLDKAIQEVNKFSALKLNVQFRKTKRQVASMQFLIKNAELISKPEPKKLADFRQNSILDILLNQFQCSPQKANQILSGYEGKYIKEKILLIESKSSYQTGKIKNLTRYLLAALKNNYSDSKKEEKKKPSKKMTSLGCVEQTVLVEDTKKSLAEKNKFTKRFSVWKKSLSEEEIKKIVPISILEMKLKPAVTSFLRAYFLNSDLALEMEQ